MPGIKQNAKTATFDASCDLRHLASCALAYKNAGKEYMPNSRAALIAAIIEDYKTMLVSMGKAVDITSVQQAHEVLTELGYLNWHKAGRSRPAFLAAIAEEQANPEAVTDKSEEIQKAMEGLL